MDGDRRNRTDRAIGKARLTAEAPEENRKGLPQICADDRGSGDKAESEALAPESERVDEGFFEPEAETTLGGFAGFRVVDLELPFGNQRYCRVLLEEHNNCNDASKPRSNSMSLNCHYRSVLC